MSGSSVPRLLTPGNREEYNVYLSDHAAADLGLQELATHFQVEGLSVREAAEILRAPTYDPETLRYRQAVFNDFRTLPGLREAFRELLPRFDELATFGAARRDATSPLQQTIWRLGELELLVECVERLSGALETETKPQSAALNDIARYLRDMRSRTDYQTMRARLPELRRGLQYKRSVTLGVNLDEKLRPVEVAVLDINDRPFAEQSLIARLFGYTRDFSVQSNVLSSPIPSELSTQPRSRIPLAPLFQEIEQLLSGALRPIQRELRAFVHENTAVFRGLRVEAAFVLGAVRLAERLEGMGLPTCLPTIHTEDHTETIEGMYNIHLALRNETRSEKRGRGSDPVVVNDLRFAPDHRFYVLTGPNQGGKTTYTQAAGIAYVFAQSGLFAPGRCADIIPVDVIETHFPTGEHGSLDTGRLADEARRLSEIIDAITDRSLVLLNESFASTSPHEAVSLASELLRVLSETGVRGVYATHLHDLALRCREFGSGVAPLTAEAIVEGESAKRTYRVREGSPAGDSFARDIALKHGLSYEQMKARLRNRGLLRDGRSPDQRQNPSA